MSAVRKQVLISRLTATHFYLIIIIVISSSCSSSSLRFSFGRQSPQIGNTGITSIAVRLRVVESAAFLLKGSHWSVFGRNK